MKKLKAFLLLAALCLGMVACGVKPPPATPPVSDPPQEDPPATVYDVAQKSVGVITARDAAYRKYSVGTAFVLTEDGKLITNYSAIEHCASAEVSIDGKTYAITGVLAWDEGLDLAVLQCDGTDFSALPISATLPQAGETVYAFGAPMGDMPQFGEGTVTAVSAEGVRHNALQASAQSGFLLNAAGQVVGLHTAAHAEDEPRAIPVTTIQNLSYTALTSLQEVYALDHAAALTKLKDWLSVKGTDADGFITYENPGETETYSVSYCEEENLLRVEYFNSYESGDRYGFHLEFSPQEEQWRYWSDYCFAEGEEVYADGTVNATEFTSKTALTMDKLTMESQRNQLGALNTAAVKNLLRWFHSIASRYADSDALDFGFIWHGKA